jgi:hypothetical protein
VADYKEIGIGVATALASKHTPNPLPVMLMGQDLPEAGRIVSAVLEECGAANIALEKVELDPELHGELVSRMGPDQRLVSNPELQCEARFFRPALAVR